MGQLKSAFYARMEEVSFRSGAAVAGGVLTAAGVAITLAVVLGGHSDAVASAPPSRAAVPSVAPPSPAPVSSSPSATPRASRTTDPATVAGAYQPPSPVRASATRHAAPTPGGTPTPRLRDPRTPQPPGLPPGWWGWQRPWPLGLLRLHPLPRTSPSRRALVVRARMTYGLLSALSWGVSTLLAAMAARRIGALRTVVFGEAVGLAGYWTLFLLGHFSFRGVGSGTAWLLVLAGVAAVVGYLAMYRGLESGHVGLVSAISACYGGVIAVLSVVLLHERLTAAAVAGIVATVAGVMLAVTQRTSASAPAAEGSAVGGASAPAAGRSAIGVAFGLTSALTYGVGGFMIGRYSVSLGWLVPVVVARGGAMVLLLAMLATPLRSPAVARLGPGLAWALVAGLADAAGLIFFTRGDQVGLVAVTAAVSSAYPVIPLIGGLLLFRERLLLQQAGGALLILAGLVLLGLGS